ncbi:hypothetical protein FOMPIDRAFT_117069 [Fomitopsis schrenkii]|uniref:Uncharacterized protein n=1 Tax=Fomitopsis schrenkii TaxID=2126942 RepID=S8FES1_FOMSC|nr:hypothetical protein FOMPIDRAFT_117069 [Fomitopsis schrenkii]
MSTSPRSTWMDLVPDLAASNVRIAPRSTPTLTTMCFSTLPPGFLVPEGVRSRVTGSVIYTTVTTIIETEPGSFTQSTLAASPEPSSSPSTTSSAVILTSTTSDRNPPPETSVIQHSEFSTPDPSDTTPAAPSTGVFSPTHGAYSASSDMSSRGAATSSPSTTSSAVIPTSTARDRNPPPDTSVIQHSEFNTPDPSDTTPAAPSTGVFSPMPSSHGVYSASSDMSSRGAATSATSSMLWHTDGPLAPASSSQGSVTSASEGPTSTTPEAAGSGRAARIALPLIIGIVGAVLLVVLGGLGVCARCRLRARMAANKGSTVYGCPASESSGDERSRGRTVIGVDKDSHPGSMLALDQHRLATDTLDAVFPADSRDLVYDAKCCSQCPGADDAAHTRGQPGVAPGAHPEHTPGGKCTCLVEDQPPREPCRNKSNTAPFEDLLSQWFSTPPAYAPARYPQRFSVSSINSTHARPFGPRPPLMSYSQLYGDQEDGTSEQTQSAGNGTYPRHAEDGGGLCLYPGQQDFTSFVSGAMKRLWGSLERIVWRDDASTRRMWLHNGDDGGPNIRTLLFLVEY